jgi:hypothetical protein
MKYLILIFFILFNLSSANAEWIHLHKDKRFDDWYLDYSSIKRVNDHVFYLTLVDHNKTQKFQSSISINQGDCDTFEWKTTHIAVYAESMAHKIISKGKTDDTFKKIENDSILGFLLKSVCEYSRNF